MEPKYTKKEKQGIYFHIKWAKLYESKVMELKIFLGGSTSFMLFIFEKNIMLDSKRIINIFEERNQTHI